MERRTVPYLGLDYAASCSPQLGAPDPTQSIIKLAASLGIDRHSGQAAAIKQRCSTLVDALSRARGSPLETSLAGRKVLIVEDEPLIAIDIVTTFERAGAIPLVARTLAEARRLVEQGGLSAAVLDFGLGDGDAEQLCRRLTEREVPFILHSGYSHTSETCSKGVVIPKPASSDTLIRAVVKLLAAGGTNGRTSSAR